MRLNVQISRHWDATFPDPSSSLTIIKRKTHSDKKNYDIAVACSRFMFAFDCTILKLSN